MKRYSFLFSVFALVLTLMLLAWSSRAGASDDENRLYNLEDAAGMFNERGYSKANSFSLAGNEVINDFNGNLMYTQRLVYLPISENGLHADFKIAYNGNVSHTAYGYHNGMNKLDQTPINLPEWIISLNGIAIQTFNFENELISWRSGSDTTANDDEVAALITGYHSCYRKSVTTGGDEHGVISILMEDGSVREYYSVSYNLFGPAYMNGGEYNSCSKDDPDRGYLWPLGSPLYGYFTLFRSDGTQVLFEVYQPAFRTNLDCPDGYPASRPDYPRILLPSKFQDNMGHQISLYYAYNVETDTIYGRPILIGAGDVGFSWDYLYWDGAFPAPNNHLDISYPGNWSYLIDFASRPPEPGLISGRGVSLKSEANRGLVWSIDCIDIEPVIFTYRSYSRSCNNLKMGVSPAQAAFHPCNGADTKYAAGRYKLEPWRVWKIKLPEGGQEFFQYYNDPATAWGQLAYVGSKDTMSINYDHTQDCEAGQPAPRFPCKKSGAFDQIGRDPFFLNMVVAARRTINGTLVVNADSLIFNWSDSLNDKIISPGDRFFSERWFGKDSLTTPRPPDIDIAQQKPQVKRREVVYRYYPEQGPFSASSRDRGWALKMESTIETNRDIAGIVLKKYYYWDIENCGGGICDGTFLLDSLRTKYDAESYLESYAYAWLGDPSLETVNNIIRKDVVDPWGIRTETYFDTSFMRLGDSSGAYYDNGLDDSVIVRGVSGGTALRKKAFEYYGPNA